MNDYWGRRLDDVFLVGYRDGVTDERKRILKYLEDDSPVWESELGTQEALRKLIGGIYDGDRN